MQVAKQLHRNSLETSPEKSLAGVRCFETSRCLKRSLTSVNPNYRNIAIFRHVTFGISGLRNCNTRALCMLYRFTYTTNSRCGHLPIPQPLQSACMPPAPAPGRSARPQPGARCASFGPTNCKLPWSVVEERGKYTCAVPTKKSRCFVQLKLRLFLFKCKR